MEIKMMKYQGVFHETEERPLEGHCNTINKRSTNTKVIKLARQHDWYRLGDRSVI